MIIALSGPAASGKGTLARMLASHLNLPHYDFGLMFRAIAYSNFQIHFIEVKNGKIFFKGCDLTEAIKTEEVGLLATRMAHRLKDLEISLIRHTDFICDGRTCGTEIYPDADFKFYITANKKERFDRRSKDDGDKEIMSQREILDESRLMIPANAIVIDTSGKTKKESLREILSSL
ncbi:MAG: (d)CMP kinase [Candidatus Staskawiczbacteria bacterium]|nr:(d)CMP kinase [Candidatus Staskawiczbacteria bacterium]